MKIFVKNMLIGAAVGVVIGAVVEMIKQKNESENDYIILPDSDVRNSHIADKLESPDANEDPAEKGLSRLDSAYRSEWQGMGYPQTHNDIDKE